MKKFDYQKVENVLGYTFKNKNLLKQAFTRRSYSKENGGLDNEVLEFIGDKVLDYYIVQLFAFKFGKTTKEGYKSSKEEAFLTVYKSALVDSTSLAGIVDQLKLYEYLLVGKNDKQNDVREVKSVKEDLFEAIVGAVALDCDWNNKILLKFIDDIYGIMESPSQSSSFVEEFYNPVGQLQDVIQQYGFAAPKYEYQERNDGQDKIWICFGSILELNMNAHAVGGSKKEARQMTAEILLREFKEYAKKTNRVFSIIGLPNEESSLQQVNELVQNGLISKPVYDYHCDYDEDGNPVWTCTVEIPEVPKYYFPNDDKHTNSKKVAQRNAVYKLLCYLSEIEDKYDDEDDYE